MLKGLSQGAVFLAVFRIIVLRAFAMAGRLSGDSVVLNHTAVTACCANAEKGLSWWDVMGAVKQRLGIPRKQQRLLLTTSSLLRGAVFPRVMSPSIMCWHCGTLHSTRRKGFKFCSGCLSAQYCSRKCQHKHWKHHKQQCRESSLLDCY